MPNSPGSADYFFNGFYPWTKAGWKYEWLLLTQSIDALNATLDEGSKLKLVWPESGLEAPLAYDADTEFAFLNERDRYASACIISTMDKSAANEKALILYGSSHGAERIYYNPPSGSRTASEWKPMGAYLADHYKGDYFSFLGISVSRYLSPRYFTDSDWRRLKPLQKAITLSSVEGTTFHRQLSRYPDSAMYDAFIVGREPIDGIFYQYVPSDENLTFMLETLIRLDANARAVKNDTSAYRFAARGKYLLFIYYLKLYFGDAFGYSFWNPATPLKDSLEALKATAFTPGSRPSAKIAFQAKTIDGLRQYHRLMRSSMIELFTETEDAEILERIEKDMAEAMELYPEDLWASYWLCYAQTKRGKFEEALEGWQRFFENPLSGCMESLPRAYSMASDCARALGMADKALSYKTAASACVNEHDIDVSDFREFAR